MTDVAGRVAARFTSRFLGYYARGKIAGDPLYPAIYDRLRDSRDPILDLGCGAGFLAFYLRERGVTVPIHGIDHDEAKIAAATTAAAGDTLLSFAPGDVRELPPFGGTILMLDLLHYFDAATQARLLAHAAAHARTVIIRDAVADGSWRYRVTYAQETFSRAVRWLQAERLNFPTTASIAAPFAGFKAEVVPLWGRTPFNNYLFVFTKP